MGKFIKIGVFVLILILVISLFAFKNKKTTTTTTAATKASSFKYIGCYADEKHRSLGTYHGPFDSVSKCFDAARSFGHQFFGLQNGNECYSGADGYDKYGKKSDDDCSFKYGGAPHVPSAKNEAGGFWRNAVYQIS